MQDFAKLYRADDTGQVLATVEPGDEGPELQISFKVQGMGRCTVKVGGTKSQHKPRPLKSGTPVEDTF